MHVDDLCQWKYSEKVPTLVECNRYSKHEWPRRGGTIEKNRSVRHSV